MYAIAFDIDVKIAERLLGDRTSCYGRIETVLTRHGFTRQQGSVFFGTEDSTPVDCVLAVQELDRRFSWFGRIVKDLRMLRVEENNDLMSALANELRFGPDDEAEAS